MKLLVLTIPFFFLIGCGVDSAEPISGVQSTDVSDTQSSANDLLSSYSSQ